MSHLEGCCLVKCFLVFEVFVKPVFVFYASRIVFLSALFKLPNQGLPLFGF